MKKIALFLISASLLASCGASNSIENKKKPTFISFELVGTIKVISNEEVYFNYKEVLFEFDYEKTRLDVNGEGTVDSKAYHFVDGVDARGQYVSKCLFSMILMKIIRIYRILC